MKKVLFFVCGLFSAISFAQNTFPTTGNVGIGTSSPSTRLEVIDNGLAGIRNLSFFGAKDRASNYTGVYIQKQTNLVVGTSPTLMRFRSVNGDIDQSYIDFEATSTTNTTRGAISFGYQSSELMRINRDGKVRIGNGANDLPTPAGYRLFVEEGILTEKVKVAVKTTANWADYVFEENYNLMPLDQVEAFVKQNKHLPNVPSAEEMVTDGLDVAETDAKLLEKIEELTLYLIEQKKQIDDLKAEVKSLKEQKQ